MKGISKVIHLLIILCFAFLTTPTYALEIHIDFGSRAPNPGGNWNTITGANRNTQVNNLIDCNTGLTTNIGIIGNGWLDDDPINDQWNGGLDKSWIANSAVRDDFYTFGSNASVTFNGLIPGQFYSIDILSAYSDEGGDNEHDVADIKVNGFIANTNANGTPGQLGDNWDAKTQGFDAANYLIWNNVQADQNGRILVTLDYVSGFGVDLTAARIRSQNQGTIPTMTQRGMIILTVLLGIGSVYYLRRRRLAT